MPKPKTCVETRFWSKVLIAGLDECWNWQASLIQGTGYGNFFPSHGVHSSAHRFSYTLTFGDIPAGLFVCHRCDNRRCVNPCHLFAGTALDNATDAKNKGRIRHGKRTAAQLVNHPRGSQQWMAILNEEKVLEILRLMDDGVSQRAISRLYGVHNTTISQIKFGKQWKHVVRPGVTKT